MSFGARARHTLFAVSVAGCTSIPAPIDPPPLDAASPARAAQPDASAPACRPHLEQWWVNVEAPLRDSDKAQLLTLPLVGPDDLSVLYAVMLVGDRSPWATGHKRRVDDNFATCTTCVFAFVGCKDIRAKGLCEREYIAVEGWIRAPRLPPSDGAFWVDLGNVRFARMVRQDGVVKQLDREDCIEVPRIAYSGTIKVTNVEPTCSGLSEITCALLARSRSSPATGSFEALQQRLR